MILYDPGYVPSHTRGWYLVLPPWHPMVRLLEGGGEELEVNCSLSLSLSSRVAKRLLGSPDTAELPSQLCRITYQEHAVLEHRPAGFPV